MTRHPAWLLVATVVVAALTARLGLWQLDRAAQKIALQTQIDQRRAEPSLPADALPVTADQAEAAVHRLITVTGTWRPAQTVYLDNRQMQARVGFIVVTPLALADGSAVLVQRGFEARDFMDRSQVRLPPTPDGPVAVTGRLARDPARLYEFSDAASGPIRQNLEIDAFARETGLALRPVTLLQEPPAPADGLQRDWPRPAADVQKHYGYAAQWFALCALSVGLYVWFRIVRPHVQARRHP